MRLDLVDIFLLLITFCRQLEVLPCANVNVDEQFQQTMSLTGLDSSIRLSFQKRKRVDYISKLL